MNCKICSKNYFFNLNESFIFPKMLQYFSAAFKNTALRIAPNYNRYLVGNVFVKSHFDSDTKFLIQFVNRRRFAFSFRRNFEMGFIFVFSLIFEGDWPSHWPSHCATTSLLKIFRKVKVQTYLRMFKCECVCRFASANTLVICKTLKSKINFAGMEGSPDIARKGHCKERTLQGKDIAREAARRS